MISFVTRKKKQKKNFIWWPIIVFILVAIGFSLLTLWNRPQPRDDVNFGVTFSINYAKELGLDWRAAYDAMLDELQVRTVRLPIYWNQVEPLPDRFDFDDYDYMIERAEETGTELIAVVGRRQPRWPECHEPPWIGRQVEAFKKERILKLVSKVVERYKDSPAIVSWQVENEPFLGVFGQCPPVDREFFGEELALVRELDPGRPIIVTESGELSTWVTAAQLADQVGISMYRITWNQHFGYWYYPLSPNFYKRKAQLIAPLTDRIIISELQAEPWSTEDYLDRLPLAEQYKSMSVERFQRNLDFARRTGFDEAYLWGVEWWYWLRDVHGDARMWDEAKKLWN